MPRGKRLGMYQSSSKKQSIQANNEVLWDEARKYARKNGMTLSGLVERALNTYLYNKMQEQRSVKG